MGNSLSKRKPHQHGISCSPETNQTKLSYCNGLRAISSQHKFFALIVLTGSIWIWWKWNHSNKLHKSNIDIYWRFVKKTDLKLRHLLDILSVSADYRTLDALIPNDPEDKKYQDYLALENEILLISKRRGTADANRQQLDDIFTASYGRKAAALLIAHLMGIVIPLSLHSQYIIVLKDAPRLLDVMIDFWAVEGFEAQTIQLIQLKQAIIQSVWPMESHLKQLPYWNLEIDQAIRQKGYKSILALNFLDNKELKEMLNKVYALHLTSSLKDVDAHIAGTNVNSSNRKTRKKNMTGNRGKQNKKNQKREEIDDILSLGKLASDLEVQSIAHDAFACIRMYPFVKMSWCARTDGETEVFNDDIVKVSLHLERIDSAWDYDTNTFSMVSKMEAAEFDKMKVTGSSRNEIYVHANKFPFRIKEKWWLMLVDLQNHIVIAHQTITDLSGLRNVDLHFRAQKPQSGKYAYRLVIKCDGYLGADKHVTFDMFVNCDNDKGNRRRGISKMEKFWRLVLYYLQPQRRSTNR
eukprot:472142_1